MSPQPLPTLPWNLDRATSSGRHKVAAGHLLLLPLIAEVFGTAENQHVLLCYYDKDRRLASGV